MPAITMATADITTYRHVRTVTLPAGMSDLDPIVMNRLAKCCVAGVCGERVWVCVSCTACAACVMKMGVGVSVKGVRNSDWV